MKTKLNISKHDSRFHCRLTSENDKRLNNIAKQLNLSKTDILLIGIDVCEKQLATNNISVNTNAGYTEDFILFIFNYAEKHNFTLKEIIDNWDTLLPLFKKEYKK